MRIVIGIETWLGAPDCAESTFQAHVDARELQHDFPGWANNQPKEMGLIEALQHFLITARM